MSKSWGLFSKPGSKTDTLHAKISMVARSHGYDFVSPESLSEDSLIFSVGGDGTALGAMRASAKSGAKVVAIHAGTLGFLTDFDISETSEAAELAFSGMLTEDPRDLACWISEEGDIALAGNEFHFADAESGKFHEWGFETSGHSPGFFSADSLLVSTPTGTTAYGLSAGGSILHPWTPAFQISAVAPLALAFRPCAVSKSESLTVLMKAKKKGRAVLRADGLNVFSRNVDTGDVLSFAVKPFDKKAVFLRRKDWCFFETVSKKLGWGAIPGISVDRATERPV